MAKPQPKIDFEETMTQLATWRDEHARRESPEKWDAVLDVQHELSRLAAAENLRAAVVRAVQTAKGAADALAPFIDALEALRPAANQALSGNPPECLTTMVVDGRFGLSRSEVAKIAAIIESARSLKEEVSAHVSHLDSGSRFELEPLETRADALWLARLADKLASARFEWKEVGDLLVSGDGSMPGKKGRAKGSVARARGERYRTHRNQERKRRGGRL
jgi:hypothetical protein